MYSKLIYVLVYQINVTITTTLDRRKHLFIIKPCFSLKGKKKKNTFNVLLTMTLPFTVCDSGSLLEQIYTDRRYLSENQIGQQISNT